MAADAAASPPAPTGKSATATKAAAKDFAMARQTESISQERLLPTAGADESFGFGDTTSEDPTNEGYLETGGL
jgi:hypothetical protein